MAAFEKYHPIMSRHYTLDWLTQFKLKDIYALRQEQEVAVAQERPIDQTMTESARFVNRAMALVMADQALVYGVSAHNDDTLLAMLGLYGFSTDRASVTIRMVSAPGADAAVLAEVLPRIIGFAVHELGLKQLIAGHVVCEDDRELYLKHHFKLTADDQLVLKAADVAELPEYFF